MRRVLDVVTVVLPVLLIVALIVIYLASPSFYLTWVLSFAERETQAVEIITFAGLTLAGLLLIGAVARVWPDRREPGGWLAVLIVASLAAAALFVAGEEIDWGDSYGLWGEAPPKGDAPALNLHNSSALPVKSIGNLYLVAVFFGLPLLWVFRDKLKLPAGLGRAVPPAAVVAAMAVAFGWREFKKLYRGFTDDVGESAAAGDAFYWNFVEQINEHKEMLIAVAFLCFALYFYLPKRTRPATDAAHER